MATLIYTLSNITGPITGDNSTYIYNKLIQLFMYMVLI